MGKGPVLEDLDKERMARVARRKKKKGERKGCSQYAERKKIRSGCEISPEKGRGNGLAGRGKGEKKSVRMPIGKCDSVKGKGRSLRYHDPPRLQKRPATNRKKKQKKRKKEKH